MDESLLRDALTARDRFVEAQHHTDSARADYHHAIRRLHASGGSTREIARNLGISHQRVHQIVDATDSPATMARKPTLLRRLTGEQDCATPGDRPRRKMLDRADRLRGDAREIMLLAEDEARSLNHNYLGTEHVLLGLLAARHSIAARILTRSGADREEARAAVERIIGCGRREPSGALSLTPRVKKVLNHARKEARFDHSVHTRGEHLLFGLLRERAGVAAQVLTALGVDHAEVSKRIARAARTCSFCARCGADVANMIAGPGVFICDRCTREATQLTTEPASRPAHPALSVVSAGEQHATCDFCGKQNADIAHLITGPGASICTECLVLCQEINDEEGVTPED